MFCISVLHHDHQNKFVWHRSGHTTCRHQKRNRRRPRPAPATESNELPGVTPLPTSPRCEGRRTEAIASFGSTGISDRFVCEAEPSSYTLSGCYIPQQRLLLSPFPPQSKDLTEFSYRAMGVAKGGFPEQGIRCRMNRMKTPQDHIDNECSFHHISLSHNIKDRLNSRGHPNGFCQI